MATSTINSVSKVTVKTYSLSMNANQYVTPFTTLGELFQPISDIGTYGDIVGIYTDNAGTIGAKLFDRIRFLGFGDTHSETAYVAYAKMGGNT